MSHSTWGLSKAMAPTILGADWDSYGIADCVVITLDPSWCCILEISIITNTILLLNTGDWVHLDIQLSD